METNYYTAKIVTKIFEGMRECKYDVFELGLSYFEYLIGQPHIVTLVKELMLFSFPYLRTGPQCKEDYLLYFGFSVIRAF